MNFVDCFPWCHLVYLSYFSALCISWLVVVRSGGLIEFRFDFFFPSKNTFGSLHFCQKPNHIWYIFFNLMFALRVENGDILNLSFLLHLLVETSLSGKFSLSTQITLHRTYKINASFLFFLSVSKIKIIFLECFKYDKLAVLISSWSHGFKYRFMH